MCQMYDVRAWCAVHTEHTCTGLVADGASGASWHRNSLVFIANALNHLDPKQLDGIGACQSFLLPPTATTTLTLSHAFDQVLIFEATFQCQLVLRWNTLGYQSTKGNHLQKMVNEKMRKLLFSKSEQECPG